MDELLLGKGTVAAEGLAARAAEISELIQKSFPQKPLSQVQTEFEATIKSAPATPNAAVAGLCSLVREQAALTIEDLKSLEMWLMIKVPEVSDGNNFGVDVQNFVLGELKALRAEVTAMLDCVSTYHGAKAAVLEKLVKPTTKTVDEESKTEKDGDKTTVKTSKTEKASSKEEPPLLDYVMQAAAIDAKEYHTCYLRLTDMRNAYVKVNLLYGKNKKRLTDPRGDGEGSRSNAMSMF